MGKLSFTHTRDWTCNDISRLIDLYLENGGDTWEIEPRMSRLWTNNIDRR